MPIFIAKSYGKVSEVMVIFTIDSGFLWFASERERDFFALITIFTQTCTGLDYK